MLSILIMFLADAGNCEYYIAQTYYHRLFPIIVVIIIIIIIILFQQLRTVFTIIRLKQPTFLRYIVFQLLCSYSLWYMKC